MPKRFTRRQMLGIGAGSLAAGVLTNTEGHAQPAQYRRAGAGVIARWPALLGQELQWWAPRCHALAARAARRALPPRRRAERRGAAVKVVDGVKVFHLVAEEVDARVRARARRDCWGYNGRVHGTADRGRRGRPRPHLRHQPAARADDRPLARHSPAQRHGRRRRPDAADPGRARPSSTSSRCGSTARFMYHPHLDEMTQMAHGDDRACSSSTRAARAGHRASTATSRSCSASGRSTGHAPAQSERDDRLQRAHDERQGVPRHRTARRARRASACGSASATSARWTTTRSTSTATTSGSPRPTAGESRSGAVAGDDRARAVGSTRDIEFVADEPGDWAFHCHMTHHVMNQMGHDFPNMIGMDPRGLDEKIRPLCPAT